MSGWVSDRRGCGRGRSGWDCDKSIVTEGGVGRTMAEVDETDQTSIVTEVELGETDQTSIVT